MFCFPRAGKHTWKNWSENLWYKGPHEEYVFFPQNEQELRTIILEAKQKGITVRASGQRHSQPPQVVHDNRQMPKPRTPEVYIIDMSFYKSLGEDGNERYEVLDNNRVKVNSGTREDDFDWFLTTQNLLKETVTAGGIFSIGGMTSNDVHGGTINCGIFAETCVEFEIMMADGEIYTINQETEVDEVTGFRPIQFARVNLGCLGIVTSITVQCLPRPFKETLQGRLAFLHVGRTEEFVSAFKEFVKHDRLECFFDPYTGGFLPLLWDIKTYEEGSANVAIKPAWSTEEHAEKKVYGAPLQGLIQKGGLVECLAEDLLTNAQYFRPIHGPLKKLGAADLVKKAMLEISTRQVNQAFTAYSEAWLQSAARCIFISYFIPLPDLDEAGLTLVYNELDAVAEMVKDESEETNKEGEEEGFHITGPMEFRFVKAGDTALSATYKADSAESDSYYLNLDLIGFVDSSKDQKNPNNYPPALKKFMAKVERRWVDQGGLPHQGKMYGFYDPEKPADDPDNYNQPFHPNFIKFIRERRASGVVDAFNSYRQRKDPTGLFMNPYIKQLVE